MANGFAFVFLYFTIHMQYICTHLLGNKNEQNKNGCTEYSFIHLLVSIWNLLNPSLLNQQKEKPRLY